MEERCRYLRNSICRNVPGGATIQFKFLHNLGLSYIRNGEYVKGQTVLEDVLTVNRRRLAIDDISLRLSSTMNLLGDCLMRQGKLWDAERILKDSLDIMKAAHSEDHVDVAHGQFTLAQCLYYQSKQSEAMELINECVRMRKSLLHADYPDVAAAVGQLERYLMELGSSEESEQYLREALNFHRHSHSLLDFPWMTWPGQ